MRKIFTILLFITQTFYVFPQDGDKIKLNPPDTLRGFPVMKALLLRQSATDYDTTELNLQDLSDLLWAANGINRPGSGKRTAPSAINAQDIDVYVIMESGAYIYDAKNHLLELVTAGDHRKIIAGRQENVARAPVILLLVSDISKFSRGSDSTKKIWAAEDAGIVSQNISVFCSATGLVTRPRASMDHQNLRSILKLKDTQLLMLNNPVAYRIPDKI